MRVRCVPVVVVVATMLAAGAATTISGAGSAGAAPPVPIRTWRIQPTPSTAGASQSALLGVSCTTNRACIGVGYSYTPDIFHVRAEIWDGRAWTVRRTPPLPGLGGQLSAVSCTSERDCVAVGAYSTTPGSTFGGTLAEVWDGRTWRIQRTSNPVGANSALSAVSCTSNRRCVAVGSAEPSTGGPEVTLAEVWDGRTWKIQPTPNPTGTSTTTLLSVSCTWANTCTAVGYSTDALTSVAKTLVEVWNGRRWTMQTAPDPAGSPFSQLGGVSCTSPHACIAVGYSFTPAFASLGSLTETWDGHAWTVQPTPNPERTVFGSVSCTSPHTCTAVGFSNAGGFVATRADVWDGNTWTDETTPNPPGEAATLSAVSCTSATTCTAVGATQSGSATLAEQSSTPRLIRHP